MTLAGTAFTIPSLRIVTNPSTKCSTWSARSYGGRRLTDTTSWPEQQLRETFTLSGARQFYGVESEKLRPAVEYSDEADVWPIRVLFAFSLCMRYDGFRQNPIIN